MSVPEQELRAMVRDAIARVASSPAADMLGPEHAGRSHSLPHASHGRLALVGGGDADGRCVIEPAVACTHCGYCQSMGH